MPHFYGTLNDQAGTATRRGSKNSGLQTTAASWAGAVSVSLYVDDQGRDCFRVSQERWYNRGITKEIATGIIGEE